MLDAYIIDWIKKEQEKRLEKEDAHRPRIWQEVPLPSRKDYRSEVNEDGEDSDSPDNPDNSNSRDYKIEISLVRSYFR